MVALISSIGTIGIGIVGNEIDILVGISIWSGLYIMYRIVRWWLF